MSPLVNALWGAGIPLAEMTAAQRRRENRALTGVVLSAAATIGVIAGLTGSWVDGLVASVVTAAVCGFGFVWVARANRPKPPTD